MCLGIPGQIVAISDAGNSRGIVSVAGVRREIHLHCVIDDEHPIESCVGDWLLVHRHADPLVSTISPDELHALLRR